MTISSSNTVLSEGELKKLSVVETVQRDFENYLDSSPNPIYFNNLTQSRSTPALGFTKTKIKSKAKKDEFSKFTFKP